MRIILLMLIALSPAYLEAQITARESAAREADRYVETVNRAAATFLNRNLSASERISAMQPHTVVFDQKQADQFKRVALDAEEPAEVRATALRKIVEHIPSDERLVRLVTELLSDPGAPKALRNAALEVEANLAFMNMNAPEVYQKMLEDPELAFRMFAFTKLVIHGDARAQQLLIRGLENPQQAMLPAPMAISVLSMAIKKEFYPAVFKVMQQTTDPATRLEAIRTLGSYPEARDALIAIAHDSKEPLEFREAALGALYSGDRDNIVRHVLPILEDPAAPPRLQAIGIRMTTDLRQAMTYRTRAKQADAYDRMVRKLSEESRDEQVRIVARRYIDAVKPRY